MTNQEQDLISAYESLPLSQQEVLELLSVVYRPVARRRALEFVQQARVDLPSAGGSEFAGLNAVVRNLIGKKLLIEEERRIQCNPDIVEAITRSAERMGRLRRWDQAANQLIPERAIRGRRSFFRRSQPELIEQLRMALHLNDAKRFNDLMVSWKATSPGRFGLNNLCHDLFAQPFDGEWLYTRVPAIRDPALHHLIDTAHLTLMPSSGPVDLLHRIANELGGLGQELEVVVRHELLVGRLDDAERLLQSHNTALSELFRGWLCFLRGDCEQALSHFDGAVRQSRKQTGKREVLLPFVVDAFYLLALIASGDPVRNGQARSYIEFATRKRPADQAHYQALLYAARLAEGRGERADDLGDAWKKCDAEPPLFQLFIYTVLCWADEEAARAARGKIIALARYSASNGYPWAESEFRQILHRTSAEPPEFPVGEGGFSPLLDTVFSQTPWERSLLALERLSSSATDRGEASGESRMTWRVSVVNHSLSVAAFQQKLGKSGRWSKGKPVSLKLLHSGARNDCLTAQDSKVCAAIEKVEPGKYAPTHYRMRDDRAAEALVGHPLVFRADNPDISVEVVKDDPQLRVTAEGSFVRIKLLPQPPDFGNVIATAPSPTRVTVCRFLKKHREIISFLGREGLLVPAGSQHAVTRAISAASRLVTVHSDVAGAEVDAADVSADSTPQIHLTPHGEGLRAEPLVRPFASEGPAFRPGAGGRVVFAIIGGQQTRAQRNFEEETRRLDAVKSSCGVLLKAHWDGTAWILDDPHDTLVLLEQLHLVGDEVLVAWPEGEPVRVRQRLSTDCLSLKIRKSEDWFEIDGSAELDPGLVMGLRELLEHVREAPTRFVQIGDKEFVALTERFRKRIQELAAFAESYGNRLRVPPSRSHALEALVEDAGSVDADEQWERRVARIREARLLDPVVPSTLQAQLREYQAEGFRWAARLSAWGAGACLADDMGLGKTVQALAVMVSRAPNGPALVVAPTSVCANWIDEARRFAPTLRPLEFGPGNRQQMLRDVKSFDLVVCSYGLLHQEADGLAEVRWDTVVLDEAQAIKNRETLRSRAAMRLRCDFRMITTATPVENHLGELWNLFHFINPGLLGSVESFHESFARPIQVDGSGGARDRLKRLIGPFILRRTKSEVLDELPAKTEITLRIEMPREERALYEAVRQQAVERLDSQALEADGNHLRILAEIMKLRRACCHPQLAMPGTEIAGSKLATFLDTVAELIDNAHKALVFSQFTSHLAIVRSHLDQQGISYRYLDGSTPARDRKREVDAFQSGEGNLFLISLRAGGQGLNLTAADYVIHLDPWWNPAVEDQASDRAHRIGQTRPVTVYRLVMKDTIEEKIVGLHSSKRDLADSLLDGTDMSGKISAEELLELIRAG